MLAWKAGDEAAFDRIVELYSDKLWALLTRFLGARPQRVDLAATEQTRLSASVRAVAAKTWFPHDILLFCLNKFTSSCKYSCTYNETDTYTSFILITTSYFLRPTYAADST